MYKLNPTHPNKTRYLFGSLTMRNPFMMSPALYNPVFGNFAWTTCLFFPEVSSPLFVKYYNQTAITGRHSKYTRHQLQKVLGETPSYSKPTYTAIGAIKNQTVKSAKNNIKVDLEQLVKEFETHGVRFK